MIFRKIYYNIKFDKMQRFLSMFFEFYCKVTIDVKLKIKIIKFGRCSLLFGCDFL